MDRTAEVTLVLKAKNLASREVDKLNKSLGGVKGHASNAGASLLRFGKIAAGVAAVGVGILATVIAKATGMAAKEQIGIERLNAALKANDKRWKGNTKAIEAVIKKREELAFSDDELRASLTILVTKYKDTDKALRLQATAMDLARLRGISLEEASTMLGRALDGNKKVLAQLGIELPKTATEQERLTAIQKAAAGQADAYGKSATGAQQAFQIATDDLLEDFGSAFLPVMTTVFNFLRTTVIPAIRSVATKIGDWLAANKPLVDQLTTFVGGVLRTFVDTLGDLADAIANVAATISSNKEAMKFLRDVLGMMAQILGVLIGQMKWVIGNIGKFVGAINQIQIPNIKLPNIKIPGFATGTDFVPNTGLALLHKGEAVIPAAQNRGGRGGSVTINTLWPPSREQVRMIVDVLDREQGYRLDRMAPTKGR